MPLHMPTTRTRRTRSRLIAALVGVVAAASWASGPASARIGGDHHSPTVVAMASAALTAHDVFSYAGTPAAFVGYIAARDATADAVAMEMGLDPLALRDAWARADLQHQEAVLAALTQLGVAYRKNTSEPGVGFDCSGLTAFAWGRAGVSITRQSSAQIGAASPRDQATAVAGDLMQYPGHVMMYLGVGEAIVHASNPSTDVALSFTSRNVEFGNPQG